MTRRYTQHCQFRELIESIIEKHTAEGDSLQNTILKIESERASVQAVIEVLIKPLASQPTGEQKRQLDALELYVKAGGIAIAFLQDKIDGGEV